MDIIPSSERKSNLLYQNAYDEYVRDFEFDDTGFMKEIAALSQKPNKKKTAELRQKYGTDSRTVREAYEYVEGLRKRRALRNAPQSSETTADRLNARREQEAKDRAYREAHPEFFPKELSEEEMRKGREEAAVSLSEDVLGAMSKSERETYERDYASANLWERRAMTASANLEYFTKAVLPEMQKAREVKNVKKSDISGSLYIDGARVSDHSLPGKYNGDDGVILSGVMSAEDMRAAVLQEIEDAAVRNNDRKQRELFYQASDLVERSGGPKIADDTETVDVVEIPENAVPKFEKTSDLRDWLIGRFNEIGSVTIESTGANVDFNVTAARRTLKNARNERNNIAYPKIEKVVSGAKYSGFREADARHQDKVKGQDVYHSAVVVDGKPYSVEFYVDVPLSEGKDNFAGNKISKIEMEPQRHGFNPVANGTNVPQGSIHTISMGVLRGKVKPARLNEGALYQTGIPEIDESRVYNSLPESLKNAVDFVFTAKPVYSVTGNEFPNDGKSLNEKVSDYYENNFGGKVDIEKFGEIFLDKKGIVSSIKHGLSKDKANAFAAVPYVLKNGKIIRKQYGYKGKYENRYVFVAPVDLKGEKAFCEVVVKEGVSSDNGGKKRFYIHEVEMIKKLGNVFTERYDTLTSPSSKSILAKMIKENNPAPFYQIEETARGAYDPSERILYLFKNADPSTIVHELGHHFTMQYIRLLREHGREAELKGILDWLGAKSANDITVEQWESLADAFIVYTKEGFAPSSKLDDLFAALKKYLTTLYEKLVTAAGRLPEISDDVREFFDTMLTVDNETQTDFKELLKKSRDLREVVKGVLRGETLEVNGLSVDDVKALARLTLCDNSVVERLHDRFKR